MTPALKLYYRAKPFLPVWVRLPLRRAHARSRRKKFQNSWPIDEGAGSKPVNWPGWPGGKEFALVLTHDVESAVGLKRVRRLAELEMEFGLRSTFNFVPEGDYEVPVELRDWLTENGFEVGVHDLHHDGHLYDSRDGFLKMAERINRYLKEWKATGFRSGFMLRNLEWLHDLEIGYDSSTFDTDPFEPQPDGCGTIFPFRVTKTGGESGSYIEMPYTLPQDSTLFNLLSETTPRIWTEKLDWICKRGGMALLNVHPDYLRFQEEDPSGQTYPVEYYSEFLDHAMKHHKETSWHARAGDVAAFAADHVMTSEKKNSRRVGMVSFSYYESDNRVLRYAEALASKGDEVVVLALRRSEDVPSEEVINGVRVVRIQDRFDKSESSALGHLAPVMKFVLRASRWLRQGQKEKPFDFLHLHNMPDFVVFAGWFPKWKGAKIVLDIHDIVPELYSNKFGKHSGGLMITALKMMEWCSAKFSHHVIVSNHLWEEKYTERTGTAGCASTFINNVDSSIFVPDRAGRDDERITVVFPGGLQWHQGVDIAIDAFKRVKERLPTAEFHIYGEGIAKASLQDQVKKLGLQESVLFFTPKTLHEISKVMASADLGVVPKRADSFGDEAYSTKIMEFMSVGVPVVASSTTIDRYYFDDSVVRFFESGSADAMAEAMVDLLTDRVAREAQVDQALQYAAENSWESRRGAYLDLVDSLCRSA